jgi:hypothetical protein
MSTDNDWFFEELGDPFDAWYRKPWDEHLAEEAALSLIHQGRHDAAASVIRRWSAFSEGLRHLMIDDAYVYGGVVFVPCTCGTMWPSQEAAMDHVRAEFEKSLEVKDSES